MSPPKTLAETTLRVLHLLRDLPMHEKGAVLGMATTLLQAEARSTELAQIEHNLLRNAAPVVTDEHYRAQ